jgi:acetyl esterase/lipase
MLILISPPVSLLNDKWPQLLLGKRTEAKTVSPAENVTQRLPPIVIIEGAADTVTPPLATRRFCDRAKQLGGSCELNLYPKLGHILSRNLPCGNPLWSKTSFVSAPSSVRSNLAIELGRQVELVPNQRIVQAWRVADWKPGDYNGPEEF